MAVTAIIDPVSLLNKHTEGLKALGARAPGFLNAYVAGVESTAGHLAKEVDEAVRKVFSESETAGIAAIVELVESISIELVESLKEGEYIFVEALGYAVSSIAGDPKISRLIGSLRRRKYLKRSGTWKPEDLEKIAALLHLSYLMVKEEKVFDVAVATYAASRIARLEGLEQLVKAALYFSASYRLHKGGKRDPAFALLGWSIRGKLPLKPLGMPHVAENPKAWKASLIASYLLDVGSMVDGVLLERWGFYRGLEQYLEEIRRAE